MIYLVTFNPAVDKYLNVEDFKLLFTNYYELEDVVYAGKSQNVCKIFSQYSQNYMLVSKYTDEIKGIIDEEYKNINNELFKSTSIRNNLKVKSGNKITELNMKIPETLDEIDGELMEYLKLNVSQEDYVLFSGSMNRGQIDFIKKFKNTNNIILDSSNITLQDIKEIQPFMIKPNDEEIIKMLNLNRFNIQEVIPKLKELNKLGVKHIIVSLGKEGSIYVNESLEYKISIAPGEVVNTVGAGDSFVGGFMVGVLEGLSLEETLKLASASGCATTYSTGIASRTVVDELKNLINIEKL